MSFPPVIPGAFRRFDTNVSADDQFLNTRDLLYARQNFNILLARRARGPLFSTTFTGAVEEFGYDLVAIGDYGAQLNFLHIQSVRIPFFAPSVQIVCYGKVTTASGTAWLYPYIRAFGFESGIQLDNGVQHTNGTGLQKVQLQIDLVRTIALNPQGVAGAEIGVIAEVHLDGANTGDPETVISAAADWVITSRAVPQLGIGEFIYVTNKISTTLRRIVAVSTVADGSYYLVSPQWSYIPKVDDTVNAQTMVAYQPDTITAWADRVTVSP